MIAHCDDDFLEQAVASVIDRVDEFVFVDGAYEWVAPFLTQSGIDPERSGQKTYDILTTFGSKVKYFAGVWQDELQKRSFGYSKCQGDTIIRIDADEIFDFDDSTYEAFLRSKHGVAEMDFPLLLSSHSQRLQIGLRTTPRQSVVFKTSHFRSPSDHCAWLWLVLTPAERERLGPVEQIHLFPDPVIRAAHLTVFRTPTTAVNRARFYTLQHVRATGQLGWDYSQTTGTKPHEKIAQIFDLMSAEEYTSYLEGHDIVSGLAPMDGFGVAPVEPFSPAIQTQIEAAERLHRQSTDALLDFSRHPRVVVSGSESVISIVSLLKGGATRIEIETADPLESCTGRLRLLLDAREDQKGWDVAQVVLTLDGTRSIVDFDQMDFSRALEAVLIFCPLTTGSIEKTRITGLRVLK